MENADVHSGLDGGLIDHSLRNEEMRRGGIGRRGELMEEEKGGCTG